MAKALTYKPLQDVDTQALLKLMNSPKVREHLIEHPLFDEATLQQWIDAKNIEDAKLGCRVKAIMFDDTLAGWCGIQQSEGQTEAQYEIAIVVDDQHWGIGRRVFKDLLNWAKEFGHKEVYLHLLDSRPEYRFLTKRSKTVSTSELLGRTFTTYQISV